MKKFFLLFPTFYFLFFSFLSSSFAQTIYLPTETFSQYLPTVKIHAFSLDDNDNLTAQSLGSGTLINNQGVILTNNHVIQNLYYEEQTHDAFQICLTKSNDIQNPICEFTASVIARNITLDLALLKIESTDIRGNNLNFNFYLPYDNSAKPQVGNKISVLGFPDTGGKTLTVTEGIISGFININNISYIKTDADISFGNSGGTTVDNNGNLIGIPTYISTSYSSESLGYIFPIAEAKTWINENINSKIITNEIANANLKTLMLSFINANETGYYKNFFPPYEINIINNWKIGNSLEDAFDQNNLYGYSSANSIVIYPIKPEKNSFLSISIYIQDYGYSVTLDDIIRDLSEYLYDDEKLNYEKTNFNQKFPAIKQTESYEDWWYSDGDIINTISYHIPYGDKVISISYSYNENDQLAEVDEILSSFKIDMSAINFEEITYLENKNPNIKVSLPENLSDWYLTDGSYKQENANFFSADFGNKKNSNFYLSIYNAEYSDQNHQENFDLFKQDTLNYATQADSEFLSQGKIIIDGFEGFYLKTKYDYEYYDPTIEITTYINLNKTNYLVIYFSIDEKSYDKEITNLRTVLKNIKLNNNGVGKYLVPSFYAEINENLSDIKNYIYQENIKNLDKIKIFGEKSPISFQPAEPLSRKDFIVWAVKSLGENEDFQNFEKLYMGCEKDCLKDVDYNKNNGMYIAFAQKKGAITGVEIDGEKYFLPEKQISLTAAIKVLFELYDYEVWSAPSFIDWYIPYLQLAYKTNILPYGVNDVSYLLTRGEGAYMIDMLRNDKL